MTIQAISADQIVGKLPTPLLSPDGFGSSSILPEAGVSLFAGEAGTDKIAAALQIAFGTAALKNGERGPVGCGLVGTGGTVLYVTTTKSDRVIAARLKALAQQSAADKDGAGASDKVLSRIHLLDFSSSPFYSTPKFSAAAAWRQLSTVITSRPLLPDAVRSGSWQVLGETIQELKPALVIINDAKIDQPAPARQVFADVRSAQDACTEPKAPGFLLVTDSIIGAFGERDSMAHEWADLPWDGVLMLARSRTKSRRVLRIPHALHGTSRLSLQLEAITTDSSANAAVIEMIARGEWIRGAYGAIAATRKSATKRAAPQDEGNLPFDGEEAPGEDLDPPENDDHADDNSDWLTPPSKAA